MGFGYWLYALLAVGAFLGALALLLAVQTKRKNKNPQKAGLEAGLQNRDIRPLERSLGLDDVKRAQDDLRMLQVEREALSYTMRHLYEAEADGKINKKERDRLAQRYKERMMKVRDAVSRSESIMALHGLEGMQGELIKLFNKHFKDLNKEIGELRTRLETKPAKEMLVPPSTSSPLVARKKREKRKKQRRSKAPSQNEAEERIEKIRADVEKALDRLGQIEAKA